MQRSSDRVAEIFERSSQFIEADDLVGWEAVLGDGSNILSDRRTAGRGEQNDTAGIGS